MSFEQDILKLEQIVKKLETPEMGIDEASKLFAEGVELSKSCFKTLNLEKGKFIEIKNNLKLD